VLAGIFTKIDWNYFKRVTIVLSVMAVLSITLASISYIYVDDRRHLNDSSQANLLNLKADYQDAVNQLLLVENYLDPFKLLESKGFIGEENRLNWIETLRKITENKKVAAIEYKIKALKPYNPAYQVTTNLFQINSSEMVLQMRLLHERDLLDIFSELNRLTAGVYDIKRCKMQRQNKTIVFSADATNVVAECTLNWFTLQFTGSS